VKGKSLAGELLEGPWIGISRKVNNNFFLASPTFRLQPWRTRLDFGGGGGGIVRIKDKGRIFTVK